ncbi:hypothetical protein [Pararhodobacter sp.]|uniref:hypothetical protein n=1 Tax=Pararhodobacter sp. TaxID=2127056 RepID=UPI002AFEC500|nr:hypothetical protein [Pararhodobacter sp.]
MLKITQNPEFTQKVKVRVPVDGGFSEQEFSARFRVVPWSELTAIETDPAEQLRRVWVGWDGIVDDDNSPIEFSDAARDRLIEILFIRTPCLRTYVDAVAGAKRGN